VKRTPSSRQKRGHCSKDSGSRLSPTFPVQRLHGVVAAFGMGCSAHGQGHASLSTDGAPDPGDTLVPLAMTPIAPLDRLGGRRPHRVVQKRQGLFQRRREDLLERLAPPRAPAHLLPQLLARAQGRLCPATSVKQRREMIYYHRLESKPISPVRKYTRSTGQKSTPQ
jgi:hypothetical protein